MNNFVHENQRNSPHKSTVVFFLENSGGLEKTELVIMLLEIILLSLNDLLYIPSTNTIFCQIPLFVERH